MIAQSRQPTLWPTTHEVAQRLGVTQSRVRQLILKGTLTTARVGRLHIVDPLSLAAYEQRVNGLARDSMGRIIDGRRRA